MARALYEYHPTIGARFIPNLRLRLEHESGGYLLQTNAQGYRSDRDFSVERTARPFRAIVLGDSFTAGDGVPNGRRFSDLIEARLSNTEVYNFGLPGSGTDQQLLIYREDARSYEHDLVVLAVQVENIRRVVSRFRYGWDEHGAVRLFPKPYFEFAADGTIELRGVPVPKRPLDERELSDADWRHVDTGGRLPLVRRVVGAFGEPARRIAQRVTHYQPLPEYRSAESPPWRLLAAIINQLADESVAPLLIVPLPLPHHVEGVASFDDIAARFGELARPPRVTVHELWPQYEALPLDIRKGFRFKSDPHPTPAHHEFLAGAIAMAIDQLQSRAWNQQ